MIRNLNKLASVLAFMIGGLAIFAGGKVLLGIDPGYYVINWVPVYNYSVGLLTAFVTAVLIWTNSRFAMPAAIATFSLHAAVMIILQTIFRATVAAESIQAMTLRLVIWTIILGLMLARSRKHMATNVQQKPLPS